MVRKSLQSGLFIGFLFTLVVALVVIGQQAAMVLPERQPTENPLIPRDLLRSFGLAVAALLLLLVGTLAAMRARPQRVRDGLNAGAISGLVAGIIFEVGFVSPLIVLREGVPLLREVLSRPKEVADTFLVGAGVQVWHLSLGVAFLVPVVGLLLGGVEGLIYALLRRTSGRPSVQEAAPPTVLDRVRSGRPLGEEAHDDHPLQAGLLGGLLVGGVVALQVVLLALRVALKPAQEVNLDALFSLDEGGALAIVTGPLSLLVPAALTLWGGSGVLLLRKPRRRFRSRFRASATSGATAGTVVLLLVVLPMLNAGLTAGLAKGILAQPEEFPFTAADLPAVVPGLFIGYPLLPIVGLFFQALAGFFAGLPFVFLSAYLWPRRPVDRADYLAGRLRRQPDALLPQIYALFQTDRRAEEVLLHLAQHYQRSRNAPAATIAAAYYTLSRQPEHTAEALRATVEVLADAPHWRWHRDIGELHRFLAEAWQARNIHHLSAIQPLSAEHTASLPTTLTRTWEHLSAVIAEVKKAHRLDDPSSRSIYLNRALEEVDRTERFIAEASSERGHRVITESGESRIENTGVLMVLHARKELALYPEQKVLSTLLPRWRAILHEALRDVRGRAVLKIELQTRQATYLPHLALRFQVANKGLNVAERVRLSLEAGPDYQLTPESEARIELLPPGAEQVVELVVQPRHPRRMRVVLNVLYNDAVVENREQTLADEVVFVETERPFRRIFPIPYVTGTPLKTGEMFFGRQDVFAYIREHLLGAYQNNIIVLHGQRRTGKTSVLYRLPEVLQDTHYGVMLDMQGIAARSEAEFFYALSDEIAYSLEQKGLKVQVPPREEYEAQPEFTFRTRFLRPLYPTLGEKHLLLMFDEFEELQRHVQEGHIGAGIFPFLRTLMQHEEKVDFIFSGTHKLEDLAAEYWSILFNIATYKQITFLERSEVERLVTEPVAPFGMEYDPLAVEHIYEVTAGHPFLTQLVCHEMVTYHNELERSYITVADVDVVLERIAERGEAHFKYVWGEADTTERAVLLCLAELLTHSDSATAPEMVALANRRGRPLEEEAAVRALVRLESRDIIARPVPGSERFRFRVDLVRRWIVRNPQLADTVNSAGTLP